MARAMRRSPLSSRRRDRRRATCLARSPLRPSLTRRRPSSSSPPPGPLGPITVIGDSVLLGSLLYVADARRHARRPRVGPGPDARRRGLQHRRVQRQLDVEGLELDSHLAHPGLGSGRRRGQSRRQRLGHLRRQRNCAYEAIMYLVDAIGPGHRIWWPKITRFYTAQPTAERVERRRSTASPPSAPTSGRGTGRSRWRMAATRRPTSTHLSADSYRKRSRVMAREITADLAFASPRRRPTRRSPQAIGAPAEFVPLPPDRVLDTRDNGGPRRRRPARTSTST